MKRYTTNWKGIGALFGILVVLWVAFASFQATGETLLISALIVTLPVGVGVLLATVFSYARIEGKTLRFSYFLYQRQTVDIDSITEISDRSTYRVARHQFRSLYVFYDQGGRTKWIEFRVSIFPERTLGSLIKELKQINPRIELNKYAQGLLDAAR